MKSSDKYKRVAELIAREAAQFIRSEAGADSLITVIRADASSREDRVIVFVSVFPEEKIPSALAFLERQRHAFSDYLKKHTLIKPLPRVDFLLDNKSGAAADALSQQ